ncbi:triphosphoribosyl-dephospho-CoA synthase [Halomicrococcus sp. SG-WS-1]|uniref:triphosphoribosyl-dephospho-CoA synthase n=1 Tax=Halomicrococcus sp. SG-WS-1 TaxID=3439057 RepID=UPI003F795BD3
MTPAENAQLALLLEVSGTPKPGNVDRERDLPDLRFEHFLAGAVGAGAGLRAAESGAPVGEAFERAVAGMSRQEGDNTQFGALLLVVPLVSAASERGAVTPDAATAVVEATTVDDTANFYRAFEHVDVFVDDPPEDAADLDVRRGADAVPAVEERGTTLAEVMALSAPEDGVAREWTTGFARTFDGAERLAELDGPLSDRTARLFLELLADEPDTLVAKQAGEEAAERVSERAAAALVGETDPGELADELVAEGLNPGTTADVVAAALFVALERGEVSV